jgi:hypothetical protein
MRRDRLELDHSQALERETYWDVTGYVKSLAHAQKENKAEFGEMDWAALNAEAEAMLDKLTADAVAAGKVDTELELVGLRAKLYYSTERANEAIALVEAAHERMQSLESAFTLILTHIEAGVPMADAPGFCGAHRNLVPDDERVVYVYLEHCAELNPSSSIAESLAWASEADLEIFARLGAKYQAREDEIDRLNREDDAREQELAESSSSGGDSNSGGDSGGNAEPVSVSVTLRNNCPSTVKLFFGDKPGFGGGKYTSAHSNTAQSMSFPPGEMIWIVDDSQNGISSTTVSAGMRTIEITKSCTGFTSK